MNLSVNQNEMWKKIKNFPSQNENKTELLLISSLTPDVVDFIDKNFADEISEDALGNYLNELVQKIDRKAVKTNTADIIPPIRKDR